MKKKKKCYKFMSRISICRRLFLDVERLLDSLFKKIGAQRGACEVFINTARLCVHQSLNFRIGKVLLHFICNSQIQHQVKLCESYHLKVIFISSILVNNGFERRQNN